MTPGRPSRSAIGLDLGARTIRAAQRLACGAWRTAVLPRASAAPLPDAGEIDALCRTLWRRGFESRRVHLGMPDALTREAAVETPPPESGAPVRQIAAAELARFYQAEPGTLEPTLLPLNDRVRRGAGFRAHAAACAREDLDQAVRTVQAGTVPARALEVHAVAAGPAAAVDLVAARWPHLCPIVLIEPGWTCLRFTVVEPGAALISRRLDDLGAGALVGQRPLSPAALAQRVAEEFDNLLLFLTRLRPDLERVPTLITADDETGALIARHLGARPEIAALLHPICTGAHDDLPPRPSLLRAAALALGHGLTTPTRTVPEHAA